MVVLIWGAFNLKYDLHKGKKCSTGSIQTMEVLSSKKLDFIDTGSQLGPLASGNSNSLAGPSIDLRIDNPLFNAAVMISFAHTKRLQLGVQII